MKSLIIGANSDIAFEFSKILASKNYDLILASKNLDELDKKRTFLERKYKNNIKTIYFNVEDFEKFEIFLISLDNDIKIVFIAVGYMEKNENNHNKIERVNYTGPKILIKSIIHKKFFLDLKKLICITSIAANRLDYKNTSYSLAKKNLSDFLMAENIKNKNISILNVKPGYVDTKMIKDLKLPSILTSTPLNVAKKIFSSLNSSYKHEVIIPFYWRIFVFLFNLKIFLHRRKN